MNEDDEAAALAHQQELEAREYHEILANDQGYQFWLNERNEERKHEICSEGFSGF